MNVKFVRRLARFQILREGLNEFVKKTLKAILSPEYLDKSPSLNERGYAPGEESIEGLALSLKRNPKGNDKNKLWVVAHFANIIRLIDDGEFFRWCKEHQKEIISSDWPKLRKELALIAEFLIRQEAYASKQKRR